MCGLGCADFVVDGLLEVALPTRTAVIAADCIRRAQRQALADGLEIDSMQQLPADFTACEEAAASGVMRESFATWLDNPRNHEVALHLVRELIERYTTLHFEDVLGAAAGPRRAEMGITHAADLLGEDGVKQTWGLQVKRLTWHPVLFIDSQTTAVARPRLRLSVTHLCVCVVCVVCVVCRVCVLAYLLRCTMIG
jgi:hypothetical protein